MREMATNANGGPPASESTEGRRNTLPGFRRKRSSRWVYLTEVTFAITIDAEEASQRARRKPDDQKDDQQDQTIKTQKHLIAEQ